jgi:Putative transposase
VEPYTVRQWVLSVPKRLRYFLQRNVALQGAVLRIFLRAVEHCLREQSPGCDAKASLGAVAFIQRFGSSLNEHIHFHCCIIEGLFDSTTNTDGAAVFHSASGLDDVDFRQVQAIVRRRILRLFVRRGLIDQADGDEMAAYKHDGGFSLDASIRIEGDDRPGLERLLRYCARPPFALKNLRQLEDGHLIYHNPKPHLNAPSDLVMTPLAMIGKIAALVPPPRWHLHRYYGVLAPNSHLRAAVTAQAAGAEIGASTPQVSRAEQQHHRSLSHYLWSQLLARIYEVFPLICPICHAEMLIISFISDTHTISQILGNIGESTQPPVVSPARGPPLWEVATTAKEMGNDLLFDLAAQHAPEFEFDQRISW